MPRLVIQIALVGAIASASACTDQELTKLEAIKTEVCACKTADCADAAMKKLPAVAQEHAQPPNYREQATARAIVDCLAKLYEQDRPKSGPEEEDAQASAAGGNEPQASAGSASPTPPAAPAPPPSSSR